MIVYFSFAKNVAEFCVIDYYAVVEVEGNLAVSHVMQSVVILNTLVKLFSSMYNRTFNYST